MLGGARDTVIKKVLQDHPVVKRLGTIHELSLNTNEHICELNIGLVGEPYPIRFSAEYEITKTSDGADFRISKIHCEKPWIEEILKIIFEAKGNSIHFPITGLAAKLVLTFL